MSAVAARAWSRALLLALALLACAPGAASAQAAIDPGHSWLGFEVYTRFGQRVAGEFPEFQGQVATDGHHARNEFGFFVGIDQAEQAAISNEATKLQMIAMLQQAEHRLIEEQRAQLNRRIMSGSNTGFPSLRSGTP